MIASTLDTETEKVGLAGSEVAMIDPRILDDANFEAIGVDEEAGPRQRLIEPLRRLEMEILRLVCDGHSNDDASVLLNIRLPTVEYHVNHVFAKLCVRHERRQ